MQLYTRRSLSNPHWTKRNEFISSKILQPNKSVLDLGCGAKDLLKYYNASKYLGVDAVPYADLIMDLDKEFRLPSEWDYVVCSGLLHCLDDPIDFLPKIKNLGRTYIITWVNGRGYGRMSHDEMQKNIERYYKITSLYLWSPSQSIFVCEDYDTA